MQKVGLLGLEMVSRNPLWRTVYLFLQGRPHRYPSEQQVHRWSIECCSDEAPSGDDGGSDTGIMADLLRPMLSQSCASCRRR